MAIDRRRALQRLGASALGLAAVGCGREPANSAPPTPAAAPRVGVASCRGSLIGMSRLEQAGKPTRYAVVRIDLHERPLKVRPIAIPFYGHGIAFDPDKPARAIVFEKHGPGCCEVDLVRGRATRSVPTTADRQFYGHGTFSRDGRLLYCTETIVGDGSRRGVVAIRDARSLELIGTLPSHGLAPHDMVLTPDGDALVISNGGGTLESGEVPNIAVVALRDGALRERLPFGDPRVNAGHVALLPDGGMVAVSAPRDGLDVHAPSVHGDVSFWHPREPMTMHSVGGPEVVRMRAETLSVAVHAASGQVVATNPEGDQLSFWDIRDGRLRHVRHDIERPRGVAIDRTGRCLAVSHGRHPALTLFDPETHAALQGGALADAWVSGSHLVVHDLS
ncbi:MAG: hypothetical protein RIT45_1041 [Pseudomonadota bacterium]|jgi:hypothetical protein